MDIADPDRFLAIARERRQVMMRSTCKIHRPHNERTFNEETGSYDDPSTTVIYEGRCQLKVKSTASPAQYTTIANAEVSSEAYELIIPFDTPKIEMSDRVEITSSDDAWIAGRTIPIAWVEYGDNRTCRRLMIYTQDRPQANDA